MKPRSASSLASGFTLLEALLALSIAGILLGGLAGVTGQSLQAWTLVREREALTQDAQFAMERWYMAQAIATSVNASPTALK